MHAHHDTFVQALKDSKKVLLCYCGELDNYRTILVAPVVYNPESVRYHFCDLKPNGEKTDLILPEDRIFSIKMMDIDLDPEQVSSIKPQSSHHEELAQPVSRLTKKVRDALETRQRDDVDKDEANVR